MDSALVPIAQQYGLPGLIMLAFGLWILRQDTKAEKREENRDKERSLADVAHASQLDTARRDFLEALGEQREAIHAVRAAIEANTHGIERLGERVARLEDR